MLESLKSRLLKTRSWPPVSLQVPQAVQLLSSHPRPKFDSSKLPDNPEGVSPRVPLKLFAVVSWGCAGTKWLAHALNSHPDILALHHYTQTVLPGSASSAAQVMQRLEKLGEDYRLVGDVHGAPRESIPELRAYYGDSFNAVVLVREPRARLMSQLALFVKQRNDTPQAEALSYIRHIRGYDVVAESIHNLQRMQFVHAVNMLNAIQPESTIGRVFRLEDIATDPEMLRELIAELSGGTWNVSQEFAAQAIAMPAFNRHRSAVQLPIEFEPWQIDVLRNIVEPETWDCYRVLGYEPPAAWLP
jgi:hypothetical protein